MKRRNWLIPILSAGLLLAGCSAPAPMLQSGGEEVTGNGGDDDQQTGQDLAEQYGVNTHELQEGLGSLAAYQDQEITWIDCDDEIQCTHVLVPVDYDDPAGPAIALALRRTGAEGKEHLLVNPGGPGGSGIDLIDASDYYFSTKLHDNFQITGWDPRGVGASAPVHCYNTEQLREMYSLEYDIDDDAGWDAYLADARAYGEACAENTGEHLTHVGTLNTVADMEMIRVVLGETKLHYLGFSYGTKLGAYFAERYPDSVGRFVLDGAMDVSLSSEQMVVDQTAGFDVAYRAYLADCLTGDDCPFTGTVDEAYQQTIDLLEEVAANAVVSQSDGREVGESDLVNALIVALYSTDTWSFLSSALGHLMHQDDPDLVAMLADIANNLDEDGNFPYDEGAIRVINCLDYPATMTKEDMLAQEDELTELSPLWGPYMGFNDVMCQGMPFDAELEPQTLTAPGAGPIVVVGTSRDPATPLHWAEQLAADLEQGVLISWDGDGHTAYSYSDCVSEAVDAFLVDGVVPHDGLAC